MLRKLHVIQGIKSLVALVALASVLFATPAWSLLEYSKGQRETIIELVEQLEERHYAKLPYDDNLSSLHLDAYLDSLDRTRMFFTAKDIEEFQAYRNTMDEELHKGDLEAGFRIFNRFLQRMEARLTTIIGTLPGAIAALNFERDEEYALEADDRLWATDDKELDDRWRKQLKNEVLRLKLAEKSDDEVAPTLEKRYTNQLTRIGQYNSQDVFQIYANALTALYDPHTNYFSPRRSENFNINMSLSLEGIGAVLQLEDEYTKVSRLVPKGPADKQGELRPSDRIVGVGQGAKGAMVDVIGWRLDEVVELIRGRKDTTVRLEVIPASAKSVDQHAIITIVRSKVKLEEQSAQKQVLEVKNGEDAVKVGVITIPAFYIDFDAMRRGEKEYKSTTRDVKKLLEELQTEGVEGIVIDLRNNGGGSLQEANELTGLFIEYGPTVQIRHSSRKVWRDGKRLKSPYYEGPLVVLINRLSASASEIFAGAIQDYERGVVVGDRSFGKGTVQTLIPLAEGQLKITESKFYRISGDSTQHRGVVPDIEFPALFDIDQVGESSLDHALNWDQINPVRHRRYDDFSTVLPQVTTLFQTRSAVNPDYIYLQDQVALAQEARMIKALPLKETDRISLRKRQENKSLEIENKRRVSKGQEPLTALEEEAEDTDELTAPDPAEDHKDPTDDVLLTEAGNILADILLLKKRRFAVHHPQESAP
jgi:carboxyl-terminal processing protease